MQVCTSLQTDNHTSTPPLSFFAGQMPFLPPNQQHQSTEGKASIQKTTVNVTVKPFLQIIPTVTFLFFFRSGFPELYTDTSEHIHFFHFLFFLFSTF